MRRGRLERMGGGMGMQRRATARHGRGKARRVVVARATRCCELRRTQVPATGEQRGVGEERRRVEERSGCCRDCCCCCCRLFVLLFLFLLSAERCECVGDLK